MRGPRRRKTQRRARAFDRKNSVSPARSSPRSKRARSGPGRRRPRPQRIAAGSPVESAFCRQKRIRGCVGRGGETLNEDSSLEAKIGVQRLEFFRLGHVPKTEQTRQLLARASNWTGKTRFPQGQRFTFGNSSISIFRVAQLDAQG